jgi:putative transposase
MLDRFKLSARERIGAWQGRVIEVNGEADHVHLLFTSPTKHALCDFVNVPKIGTSGKSRSEIAHEISRVYRKPVLWSRPYCVISCGGAPLSVLRQYIEQPERPD